LAAVVDIVDDEVGDGFAVRVSPVRPAYEGEAGAVAAQFRVRGVLADRRIRDLREGPGLRVDDENFEMPSALRPVRSRLDEKAMRRPSSVMEG
jgi:hypothetical protein